MTRAIDSLQSGSINLAMLDMKGKQRVENQEQHIVDHLVIYSFIYLFIHS